MAEIQSAVRIPTPPPNTNTNGIKRKEPPSRSPSPPSRRPALRDVSPNHNAERERIRAAKLANAKPMTDEEKAAQAKKDFLSLRSGGAYIPPARLRAMQASIPQDKKSEDFQRLAHDARKKSINGLVNKLNTGNLKAICMECFDEDLMKARGLFCVSLMKAQAASPSFTSVYAALVTAINSKLPAIGELLQKRLMIRWAKAFKRNEKAACVSSSQFLAHLCNQSVVSYLLLAQILQLLLTNETDDSVEIAVNLMREVGQHLEEANKQISNLIFDRLREILQGSSLEKRTLYAIEVLFQVRRDKFANNPAIPEGLDVIEEDDKITLDPPATIDEATKLDSENSLNIFKYDAAYEEHEAEWSKIRAEILGENSGSESDSGSAAGSDSEDESSEDEEDEAAKAQDAKDMTNEELVKLRRKIYLTIASSSSFEEAAHKILKLQFPAGKESELPMMIVETCSQRPTYEKFYGLLAQRLCDVRREMREGFEAAFTNYYNSIHRYDNNRIRAIAQLFGHLIGTEAIGWYVFSIVTLSEEDTTSSSRIFIKILFEAIVEEIGTNKLQSNFRDQTMAQSYASLFPMTEPKNTRFAINFFTSIGMGQLTEDMRTHLANMPKPALPAAGPTTTRARSRSESRSSYSSYTSSYDSRTPSSRSRSRSRSRSYSSSRSPSPRRCRDAGPRGRSLTRSISSSRSPSPRRRPHSSRSRTPPRPRRRRSPTSSRSRTPPRRRSSASRSRSPPRQRPSPRGRRAHSSSMSRSPPPRRAPVRRERSPSSSPRRGAPERRGYRSSSEGSRSPVRRRSGSSRSRAPRRRRYSSSRSPPGGRRGGYGGRGRGRGMGRGRGGGGYGGRSRSRSR